ncbi:MAG: DUF1223 domain-containing protein [Cyclobacteriaceae bacterium]
MVHFWWVLLMVISLGWTDDVAGQGKSSEPVVLIELFTSQGCSSCPAADRLLTSLLEEPENKAAGVIGLSFHVSYWNRLGWRDPYSSETYTIRQRNYGRALALNTIYTPQMIVNGKYQFVGSDERKATESIGKALKLPPRTQVELSNVHRTAEELSFDFRIEGKTEGREINFALVEKHLVNYVPRGENSGRTLEHDNVVRVFDMADAKSSGNHRLKIKDDKIDLKKCLLIAYVQREDNFEIEGACQMKLNGI